MAVGFIVYVATSNRINRISNNGVSVTAHIVSIGRTTNADGTTRHAVSITYTVDGTEIIARLNHWNSNMFVGQQINIIAYRDNPQEFIQPGVQAWVGPIVAFSIALPFTIVGVVFLVIVSRKNKMRQWLFENGTPIWAEVIGTDINRVIRVNNRPATVLVASYNNMEFVSDPVDNNDLVHVQDKVKIFLHPDDFNKYAFDITNESYRTPD